MKISELLSASGNFNPGNRKNISYIVVHYTGNKGDTAANNAKYFNSHPDLKVGAHYFVDEKEVWRSIKDKDTAYHCGSGGKTYRHKECRNSNSLGIEICMWDKHGNIRQGSIDNAAALVRELMAQYGVDKSHILRHYDVTGKLCPAPMVDNETLWSGFLAALDEKASDDEVRYKRLYDIPAENNFRAIIDQLMTAGIICGDGSDPNGNNDVIDLSHDMVRMLIFNYRAGIYDDALRAACIYPEEFR